MEPNYIDELVIHEHGTYDINKYKEWVYDWYNWLKYCGHKDIKNKEDIKTPEKIEKLNN
jgi:hypothetical protein